MVQMCEYVDKQAKWNGKWISYCVVCEKESCLERDEKECD